MSMNFYSAGEKLGGGKNRKEAKKVKQTSEKGLVTLFSYSEYIPLKRI